MTNTTIALTSGEPDEYLFRTGDAELMRLGYQHRAWGAQTYAIWERAGFAPGWRILDLGSGPGYCTVDLAHLVGPSGAVIAVDASERFLAHIQKRMAIEPLDNVQTIECDVNELELPAASLDGAYARWLMCFLPDPRNVIRRVASALRPGGVFAIQDYSNYRAVDVLPKSAAFRRGIEAFRASWEAHGGDQDIASRLPELLVQAGFDVREAKPLVRTGRPGTSVWAWPDIFFRLHIPALVETGYLSEADGAAFLAEWEERGKDPNAVLITPPMMDIIAVRGR